MTKNRFKQVCNYFYGLKNGCCGKMFETDIIDDIINIYITFCKWLGDSIFGLIYKITGN